MKISKESWHYKWFAKDWDTLPKALCWYFWKVVGSVITRFAQICFVAAICVVAAAIITYPIWQIFFRPADLTPPFLSFLVWLAIGGFVLRGYCEFLVDSGKIQLREKKPPGLLASYIGAKHRRICPLLQYRDD